MDHDAYENPLATRYAGPAMSYNWSPQKKFSTWRRLWLWLAQAEHEAGLPVSRAQVDQIREHLEDIDWEAAAAHERRTRHDVMAHVHTLGEAAPLARPILHLGATSCYVGDNTDLIQMRDGLLLVVGGLTDLLRRLADFATRWHDTPALGMTHLQAAQLTTVGKRACLWMQDFLMDARRIEAEAEALPFRGVKGTTGTQASFLGLCGGDGAKVDAIDARVRELARFRVGLAVCGQTYTRKVDYVVLAALAALGQSAEKMATDLRLLASRKEIEEPFEAEQIGSSAMPYKRNPMRCERICGLARWLQGMPTMAGQTAAHQWMERTLDDSAGRRLYLPQAFLAADAVLRLCNNVVSGLVVWPAVISANIAAELPFMVSEDILMAAVRAGGDRQDLHEAIRRHSQAAARRVKADGKPNDLIDRLRLDPAFDRVPFRDVLRADHYVGRAPHQVAQFVAAVEKWIEKHQHLLTEGPVRLDA